MAASKSLNAPMSEVPSPAPAIPKGFELRQFGHGFIGVNGPLYTRITGEKGAAGAPGLTGETGATGATGAILQMGFRVEARHTNPMNICHGGMMASFCDMLLPISAQHLAKEAHRRFCPTISLQIDYLAMAPLGAWVQGEAQVLRVARTMIFMQGLVTADGVNVARASGVFKIGPSFDGFLPVSAPKT